MQYKDMKASKTDVTAKFSKEEEAEAVDRLIEEHKEIYYRLAKL